MSNQESGNRPPFKDPKDPKNQLGDSLTIHWRVKDWFKDLSDSQHEKLKAYHDELLKFNKAVNLIGVKTIPQADVIHFADAILAARQVLKITGDAEIYDIGSGNGFPGLVMAILAPSSQIILVDADQRKCEFLKHMTTHLKLNNVKVMNTQVERLGDLTIQYAVCRGFASVSKTILLLRKIVKKGGIVFHMKSEEWFKEVSEIPTQLCSFWKPSLVEEYRLPVGQVTYSVVRTDKIAD